MSAADRVRNRWPVAWRSRLQQYLKSEPQRIVERPALTEVLARIESRTGRRVGFDQAVTVLTTT